MEATPTIAIDTREQTPLQFPNLPSLRTALQTGDYSLRGAEEIFAVERKTISDLVGCCTGDNRERFEREMHRLRGYRFKRLLIIGSEQDLRTAKYRSNIHPNAVIGGLKTWEIRFDLPVIFAPTPMLAAELIECWARYFAREALKTAERLQAGFGQVPIGIPVVPQHAQETLKIGHGTILEEPVN